MHEQCPQVVPRCDVVHELACTINDLQDEVTVVLGQGFAVLATELISKDLMEYACPETDPDPELTEFLGSLGVQSANNQASPYAKARRICIEQYDVLQARIQWCEDTITYHANEHTQHGHCPPTTIQPWLLSDIRRRDISAPSLFGGFTIPQPRTPLDLSEGK